MKKTIATLLKGASIAVSATASMAQEEVTVAYFIESTMPLQ